MNTDRMTYRDVALHFRDVSLPRRVRQELFHVHLKIDKIRRRACEVRCLSCVLRRIVRDANTAPLLCKMPLLIASLEPESSRWKFQGC